MTALRAESANPATIRASPLRLLRSGAAGARSPRTGTRATWRTEVTATSVQAGTPSTHPRFSRVCSVEEVGLGAHDALIQRLEAEPSGVGGPYSRSRGARYLAVDRIRRLHGLGQQLDGARPVHGDEPEGGLVDRPAHGEQPVVAEDDGLAPPQGMGDALGLVEVEDDAGVIVEQGMVLIERAGILGDRVEQAAGGRPRLAVERVSVGGGHYVGTSGVHLGVDGKGGSVDGIVAVNDLAAPVDQAQIRDPDQPD